VFGPILEDRNLVGENTADLGKYELVSRLAMGGMAELFLAREKGMAGLERLVVIKRILPHLSHQKSFVEMFLREARIAARLNHPNIVNIYDLNTSEGAYYIAMEYIHGTTVRELQILAGESGARFPLDVMISIVDQAARGLHAAHELRDLDGKMLGVVHRDVSPHNLMCTPQGNVKLLDFGVAKATSGIEMTFSGNLKGKFAYMSPEQCHRSQLDRRSDIFSLGIIAWELSVGQRLFKRHTELEMLQAITNGDIARPSALGRKLSIEVEDVIMKALSLDRDRRFDTAEEMRIALGEAAKASGIEWGPDRIAHCVNAVAGKQLMERDATLKSALERSLTLNESKHLLHRTGSHTVDEIDTRISGFEDPTRTIPSASMPSLVQDDSADDVPIRRDSPVEQEANRSMETVIDKYVPVEKSSSESKSIAQSQLKSTSSRAVVGALIGAIIAGLLLVGWWWLSKQNQTETVLLGEPMKFGWAPTVTPEQLAEEAEVLRGYLERSMGRPVPMTIAKDYDDLRIQLINGDVDYAMMPPYLYVITKEEIPDLEPLVFKSFDGAAASDGMLLVRIEDPIRNLADLEGKTFCFTDTKSTTGYIMPRAHIRQQGFDPDTFVGKIHWSGNHLQVMQDLLDKKCDAAATYSGSYLSAESLNIKAGRLRPLESTGTVPQDAVVAMPRVKLADRERLREVFVAFDPEKHFGKRIVGTTQRMEAFLPATDDAYQDLRKAILLDQKTKDSHN